MLVYKPTSLYHVFISCQEAVQTHEQSLVVLRAMVWAVVSAGPSCLQLLLKEGGEEVLTWRYGDGDGGGRDRVLYMPLHAAACVGGMAMARELIAAGFKVHAVFRITPIKGSLCEQITSL